ncbi:hypothetical protein ASD07_15745 [Duganella sp. Root336D2]|nr:hypothetical protein ASD07_15745 [Duganella sp. Root336D2]
MGFWSRLLGKNRATLISSTVEVVQKDSHSSFDLFAGGIAPVVPQSTSFEVASLHFRTIFIKNISQAGSAGSLIFLSAALGGVEVDQVRSRDD